MTSNNVFFLNEGVHDGHGSLGDTSLLVNLLKDSEDVD